MHQTNLISWTKKCVGLFILIIRFTIPILAQEIKVSAEDIIQRAIDNSGGDSNLDAINSVEFISQIITSENDTLSFAIKRKGFSKYYISTLSTTHVNSTTIYNNGNAVIIKNETVQKITDPMILEELLLQSYVSINYGYKKLGYKLNRLDDQKFNYFDCYVVMAESPLEKKTLNYYDKKTGNLIMIVYPNQNKSLFIDNYQAKGIICPSKILMVDTANKITQSTLTKINYQTDLDTNWFNLPNNGIYKAPDLFQTGHFKYINSNPGAETIREKDTQIEINGKTRIEYKIKWTSNNDYLLYRVKNISSPPTNENTEYFKVRIITWNGNKYYCQYITSNYIGGTCAFEKME